MDALVGRGRELGTIRTALDRVGGSLVVLSGVPGSGKTRLALAAAVELPHLYHRVPPLPEPQQRAAFAASLRRAGPDWPISLPGEAPEGTHVSSTGPGTWEELLAAAAASVPEGRGAALVIDDADRLERPGMRFLAAARAAMRRARDRQRSLHVLLLSPTDDTVGGSEASGDEPVRVRLGSLGFSAAAPLLPGSRPIDRLRAYAIFGGLPRTLALLDASVSLSTNLRRLVLRPESPLADEGTRLMERAVQAPGRYMAILAALSGGETNWGGVHAGVADLTASGQVAPYLQRLEAMGLIEARRSLDAGARTRNRRYRISDPLHTFWFRFVFPHRERFATGDAFDVMKEALGAGLDDHIGSIFPEVCRQHMRQDAIGSLGANARECGSLWGGGYDIPVAGILTSGAAFYGRPAPAGEEGESALRDLDRQIRGTRYGFGRELRLRVLFVRRAPSSGLVREVARRHDAAIVGVAALAGEG